MSSNNELSVEELVINYPDVPKFVILKLDVQRRGIQLTEKALDAVQSPQYCFGRSGIFQRV